jgi:hypothetical protein
VPAGEKQTLPDTIEGSLACEYFGQTAQTLAIRTSDGDLVRLVDLDFQVSPFLPSDLSCSRWLETVWNRKGLDAKWKVRPTLSKEGIREGRLLGSGRIDVYQSCFDSPFCRVRFPYNIGWWRAKKLFTKDAFSPFGLNKALCEQPAKARPVKQRKLRDVAVLHEKDLAEVTTWDLTQSELADQVVELIRREKEGVILAATMIAENAEIEKIVAELGDHPLMTVYLLFDAAVSISSYDIHEWIQSDSDQLFLVPITPRPDRPAFFHLKGAAAWGGAGWLTFTSANLMSHSSGDLIDLGFTAKGKPVADALAKVFADQIREACMEPEYLTCTLDARTSNDDPLRYQLRAALADTCRAFFDTGLSSQLAALSNPYFVVTTEDDVVDLLAQFVAKAQRSVGAFTNRVDSWPFLLSMEEARKGGKETDAFAGRKGDHPVWEVKDFQGFLHALKPREAETGIAHAKFVLIDDKEAFWGTGNLTKNGLAEATELFFFTDHPALLGELKEYAREWMKDAQR